MDRAPPPNSIAGGTCFDEKRFSRPKVRILGRQAPGAFNGGNCWCVLATLPAVAARIGLSGCVFRRWVQNIISPRTSARRTERLISAENQLIKALSKRPKADDSEELYVAVVRGWSPAQGDQRHCHRIVRRGNAVLGAEPYDHAVAGVDLGLAAGASIRVQ